MPSHAYILRRKADQTYLRDDDDKVFVFMTHYEAAHHVDFSDAFEVVPRPVIRVVGSAARRAEDS